MKGNMLKSLTWCFTIPHLWLDTGGQLCNNRLCNSMDFHGDPFRCNPKGCMRCSLQHLPSERKDTLSNTCPSIHRAASSPGSSCCVIDEVVVAVNKTGINGDMGRHRKQWGIFHYQLQWSYRVPEESFQVLSREWILEPAINGFIHTPLINITKPIFSTQSIILGGNIGTGVHIAWLHVCSHNLYSMQPRPWM